MTSDQRDPRDILKRLRRMPMVHYGDSAHAVITESADLIEQQAEEIAIIRRYCDDWQAMVELRASLLIADRKRLAAIVERLPKTADGTPIVDGDTVWFWIEDMDGDRWQDATVSHVLSDGTVVLLDWLEVALWECYSTREAAEAAAEGGE